MEETPVVFTLLPKTTSSPLAMKSSSDLVEVTRNQLATSIEDLYDTQCKLTELDMYGSLNGMRARHAQHAP